MGLSCRIGGHLACAVLWILRFDAAQAKKTFVNDTPRRTIGGPRERIGWGPFTKRMMITMYEGAFRFVWEEQQQQAACEGVFMGEKSALLLAAIELCRVHKL
jgi:hypothetical protein